MKKRGQLTLKALIELVVAFTLFLLFIFAGKMYGSGEAFQKVVLARDNAILINSLNSFHGNGYITYPTDVSKFFINYKDDSVKVFKSELDPFQATYSFVKINEFSLDYELKKPKKLILSKTNKIEISTDKLPNINKITCLDIETNGNKNILIDAGHGDGTELKTDKLDEAEITNAISRAFYAKAQGKFADIAYTRSPDNSRLPDYKINELAENAGIIISIHTGSSAHDRNEILKIYYSSNKHSEKLACLVLNRILDQLDMKGAIIPKTDSILRDDKTAILIEIGNIQYEKGENILADQGTLSTIASAIINGLEDYYE